MGQVLHGGATTTHAIRAAIQRSKAPLKELAARYGLNQKTVAKWRKRSFLEDAPMGPKAPRSTVLTAEEEAMVVAVALANKTARIVWALLAKGGIYRAPELAAQPPQLHRRRSVGRTKEGITHSRRDGIGKTRAFHRASRARHG